MPVLCLVEEVRASAFYNRIYLYNWNKLFITSKSRSPGANKRREKAFIRQFPTINETMAELSLKKVCIRVMDVTKFIIDSLGSLTLHDIFFIIQFYKLHLFILWAQLNVYFSLCNADTQKSHIYKCVILIEEFYLSYLIFSQWHILERTITLFIYVHIQVTKWILIVLKAT